MRLGFRGRSFIAIFGVAAAALLLVATLVSLSLPEQTYRRIEQSLVSEAHLVADVLSAHERDMAHAAIEDEAIRIGKNAAGAGDADRRGRHGRRATRW